jgi:parvulin-like peptidyl-prolyl cis-trans isomerase-like protein
MVAANGIGLQNGKMQFPYQKNIGCTVFLSSCIGKPTMLALLPACLLAMTSFVIGQDRPKASSTSSPRGSVASAPVLIVHGLCPAEAVPRSNEGSCERPITHAEFDQLISALDPKMPESNRLALATEYVRLLTLAREAERLKLDQTPEFKILEDFNRLQLMERQLVRKLSADSSVSESEVAEAFAKDQKEYAEGIVRRIMFPKEAANSTTNERQEAEAVRKRVVAGEDIDKLQGEIWRAKGRTGSMPSTRLGPLRRSALPPAAREVFDLKAGEVAPLFDDRDGYYIYKLESKTLPPLETVAPAIRGALASEHLQARMRSLRDAVSISVNEDYFGPLPRTEDLARHHGMQHAGSPIQPMTEKEKKRLPR